MSGRPDPSDVGPLALLPIPQRRCAMGDFVTTAVTSNARSHALKSHLVRNPTHYEDRGPLAFREAVRACASCPFETRAVTAAGRSDGIRRHLATHPTHREAA